MKLGRWGTSSTRDHPGLEASTVRTCRLNHGSFLDCSLSQRDAACFQARKRHINIIFFVRLVLGRPRVCPGDLTGFVPGTNPVKTWDKPGSTPYFTQWKPDFTGFVPGTNPVCPWDSPGDEGAAQKVYVKKVYVPFSLASFYSVADLLVFKKPVGNLSCFGEWERERLRELCLCMALSGT